MYGPNNFKKLYRKCILYACFVVVTLFKQFSWFSRLAFCQFKSTKSMNWIKLKKGDYPLLYIRMLLYYKMKLSVYMYFYMYFCMYPNISRNTARTALKQTPKIR